MAANLVKAGHAVTGFDLNPAALDALAKAGGKIGKSAADAAAGASVVITMLPAGEHVREVYLNQGGLIDVVKDAKPLLIDCSTIDVESARTVTATAETAGLAMLDAPVSGGTAGAQNGTLTFMVGGTEEAFARGKPVLEAMGKNIFHAGGPGAGQAVKICNNMMLAINMVGVSEGFLLAQKLGLDWDKLHQICATATGELLGAVELLPGTGTGSRGAVQPRLRAGFRCRADGEGRETVAGRGRGHRFADAAGGQGAELLSAGRRCGRWRKGFFRCLSLARPAEAGLRQRLGEGNDDDSGGVQGGPRFPGGAPHRLRYRLS